MSKLYALSIRWPSGIAATDRFEQALREAVGIKWLRFSSWSYFVWTHLTPVQLYEGVSREKSGIDEVLIFETHRDSRYGWSAEWVWKWIDSLSDEA